MCEQSGVPPDPNKMPLDFTDFPYEVQVAFFIFNLLPDNYVGMDGIWNGKDWSCLETFFSLYKVYCPETVFHFMKLYETKLIELHRNKRKQEEERQKAETARGGKKYTHKVQG